MKTGSKIISTPRGDDGEEPNWVCKYLQRHDRYLCCIKVTITLIYQAGNIATVYIAEHVL
jgi:hypothetical protein